MVTGLTSRPVGVVVIGRNEGDRLKRCLASIARACAAVVYVDSGSSDGSQAAARGAGADVVVLDLARPFTAARARNEGFRRLGQLVPGLELVQFVDGDCELRDGWIERGAAVLEDDPATAAVCGRLRERHPERSIYIRMCDIGWDLPAGEAAACGGVAMYRADRFAAVGGFDEALIAGEEFELCVRLRKAGGRILRIEADMAWHDVGITRFGQWWNRAMRAGYAYAEGWSRYAQDSGSAHRRGVVRSLAWGVLVPGSLVVGVFGAVAGLPLAAVALIAALALIAQSTRIAVRQVRRGRGLRDSACFGLYLTLGKMPEAEGALRYWWERMRGQRTAIIEYR